MIGPSPAQPFFRGARAAPEGFPVWNPAFDVTPARLVTGLVTERGIIAPSREALARAFAERDTAAVSGTSKP